MAKKKAAKKKVAKKPTRKTSGAGGSSSRKKTKKTSPKTVTKTTKKAVKKTVTKKAGKKAVKKVIKKSVKKTAQKAAAKTTKKVSKKTTRKATAKKATKKIIKKAGKKSAKTTPAVAKKTTKPKTASKKKPPQASAAQMGAAETDATLESKVSATDASVEIESTKSDADTKPPLRKRRPSKVKKPLVLPDRPLLLGPDGPALKPLIPSGAKVKKKKKKSVLDNVTSRRTKTPLTKSQLEHYRHILLVKRAELLGDMRHLEKEAMRKESGEANASVHLDEQGSESYEQSLNLNLAASDRELIHEIDDALKRITNRTYGLCELTHEPIKKIRLDELPWARYTIHAARELDQRGGKL